METIPEAKPQTHLASQYESGYRDTDTNDNNADVDTTHRFVFRDLVARVILYQLLKSGHDVLSEFLNPQLLG